MTRATIAFVDDFCDPLTPFADEKVTCVTIADRSERYMLAKNSRAR